MSDTELIERLAEVLANRVIHSVPINLKLWDIKSIGAYLNKSPAHVREKFASLPSFPKAIRLPSAARDAHALYKASEVITWAESYKDKN
mgnify:CR=1 FL=1|tara:strand:- start:428 stop:694 length:267 start_codon:yes stop_codon:yes gene_type:complete